MKNKQHVVAFCLTQTTYKEANMQAKLSYYIAWTADTAIVEHTTDRHCSLRAVQPSSQHTMQNSAGLLAYCRMLLCSYETSKVTSALLRIHSDSGAMYVLYVRIRDATMAVEKKLVYLLFAGFWLKILPQLNLKAVHNLKTKSLGIILTPSWAFSANFCNLLIFCKFCTITVNKFLHKIPGE